MELDGDVIRFPACGRALPGHEIRVVDETGRELPDRRQGRIQFRGPSATSGYYRNPEKTRELFDGEWLNTGDLGYTVAGDIYVTGRVKDVVIRAGRNIYPEELEELIGDLAGVRKGRVAVFGSVETPDRVPNDWSFLRRRGRRIHQGARNCANESMKWPWIAWMRLPTILFWRRPAVS